jgi:hypothetical protein
MSRLASVLSPHDLPAAELQAARLDGELFGIDSCYCPIDEIESPAHRGAALAALVPSRLIAEQRSAAWIWGAGAAPARHQFCASVEARVRPAASLRISVREVVIDDASVVDVGGILVTTILRTIVDLARFSEDFSADREPVGRLMELGRVSLRAAERDIHSRRNLPNKRRAIERLRSVSPN